MMRVVSYLRANLFNSSSAACELLEKKPEKYYDLVTKILSVKIDAINLKLQETSPSRQNDTLLKKQDKYMRLIDKVDFLVKKTHCSDNGKYWATPLFINHSCQRLNTGIQDTLSSRVAIHNRTALSDTGQTSVNSWFNYLQHGDRENGVAFFSQPLEGKGNKDDLVSQPSEDPFPRALKTVSFCEIEDNISYDTQSQYSDSFESHDGVIEQDSDYYSSSSGNDGTQARYVNVDEVLHFDKLKMPTRANQYDMYEPIYSEIAAEIHSPPQNKA